MEIEKSGKNIKFCSVMEVFITGISGYIGQRILEILKERKKKFSVRRVDLKPLPDNFRVRKGKMK